MLPAVSGAADDDLQQKIDKLSKEVDALKGQVKKDEDKSLGKWLTIGGEYRLRGDSLHGKTVPYSDAIGTMGTMVGRFLNDNTVADGTINPSALSYLMAGKTGALFTKDQFGIILNNYMPQAMFNFLTVGGNASQFNQVVGQYMATYGSVDAALAAKGLTAQQNGILNTLTNQGVMNAVMTKLGGGNLAAGQAAFQAMIGQLATQLGTTPTKAALLANTALLQSFLGAGSPNLQQVQAYKPKNETLFTNKFSLDLHAKATQDVTVNARLSMYKSTGSENDSQVAGNFFADRVGVFDGTLSHVPSSSLLNVDRAYATWSNIADQPAWISVGRRPSTDGAPTNLKLNNERPGNGGTPAMLIDYAFDGFAIGYAPDIEALPGAYAKLCGGRGFDSGFKTPTNSVKDSDFFGVTIVPIDSDPLRVWFLWDRAFNLFDFPVMNNTVFGNTAPAANLGDIDWYGAGAMSTIKKVGPGNLNFFADFAMSKTHPGGNVSQNAGFQGLLTGQFFAQEAPSDKTGYSVWAGMRYDLPSKTKLGFEYNHGSKNWITFTPAADDLWTSKNGTRGNVYEGYIIQELNLKPISSYLSKAFFKVGYQYYDFEYTGSNNWVGAPVKISDIKPTDLMLLAPLKEAHDVYATFEVHF
ncbi:MAG TPA: DUF3373 domain-containing protein [Desulfuromonadaceae bacterium]